jgi:hypothetical protein
MLRSGISIRAAIASSNARLFRNGLAHRHLDLTCVRSLSSAASPPPPPPPPPLPPASSSPASPLEPLDMRVIRRLGMHPDDISVPASKAQTFRRWTLVPAAMANHIALGSVFAWSIFNEPLTRLHGVVSSSTIDWALTDTTHTFGLVLAGFAWGGLLSTYVDRWGPRASCALGSLCIGAGFLTGAAAISVHSLPLLYLAGGIWGFSLSFAYVQPVVALLKWFPGRCCAAFVRVLAPRVLLSFLSRSRLATHSRLTQSFPFAFVSPTHSPSHASHLRSCNRLAFFLFLSFTTDRKGFASSACLLGFGGGAMLAAPLFTGLLRRFQTPPTFVGGVGSGGGGDNGVELIMNDAGALLVQYGGELRDAVVATAADARLHSLADGAGVYLAGTGSTGAAETFATMGLGYTALMLASSFVYRIPPPAFVPITTAATTAAATAATVTGAASTAAATAATVTGAAATVTGAASTVSKAVLAKAAQTKTSAVTTHSVAPHVSWRTPQFWILGVGFGAACTGSYALITVGTTILNESMGAAYPRIVTASFAASFVAAMSVR